MLCSRRLPERFQPVVDSPRGGAAGAADRRAATRTLEGDRDNRRQPRASATQAGGARGREQHERQPVVCGRHRPVPQPALQRTLSPQTEPEVGAVSKQCRSIDCSMDQFSHSHYSTLDLRHCYLYANGPCYCFRYISNFARVLFVLVHIAVLVCFSALATHTLLIL